MIRLVPLLILTACVPLWGDMGGASGRPGRGPRSPYPDAVKGAVVVGVSTSGACIFKPFVKTGDTEDGDSGPQILGYSPGGVVIDSHGKVVLERVDAANFIERNHAATVHGHLCKAPDYNE